MTKYGPNKSKAKPPAIQKGQKKPKVVKRPSKPRAKKEMGIQGHMHVHHHIIHMPGEIGPNTQF